MKFPLWSPSATVHLSIRWFGRGQHCHGSNSPIKISLAFDFSSAEISLTQVLGMDEHWVWCSALYRDRELKKRSLLPKFLSNTHFQQRQTVGLLLSPTYKKLYLTIKMDNKIIQQHLRVIRIKQLPPFLQKGVFSCYAYLLLIPTFECSFQVLLNTVYPEVNWASSSK